VRATHGTYCCASVVVRTKITFLIMFAYASAVDLPTLPGAMKYQITFEKDYAPLVSLM
jgi:hypothetical protein